jgi:3'-phosphoadenosine 5'-phosphosulfate (PAPS) 3'-phosphatase
VVYAPAKGVIYWSDGTHSYKAEVLNGVLQAKQQIKVRARPDMALIVASRSHRDAQTDAFCQTQGAYEVVSAGSSIKFCLVAEGTADLYPRFAPTMQWDTAAGHAVLKSAGGKLTKTDGAPFEYGLFGQDGKLFLNPSFIASAS